jgi:Na+/melibiose symporter-like transporter
VEPGARAHVNRREQRILSECWIQRMPEGARMLVSILITFLVVILVLYLINLLPLDGRAKQIARVVVIILGVISLLKYIAVI